MITDQLPLGVEAENTITMEPETEIIDPNQTIIIKWVIVLDYRIRYLECPNKLLVTELSQARHDNNCISECKPSN